MTVEEIKALLKSKLTEYRYHHSLCVADRAREMALKHGLDAEKAYFAGLVHDITKDTSLEEQKELFKKYNFSLTEVEEASEKLWHAMSGALYVKNVLGVNDKEIIDAVRYHTTAKGDLSTFGKIIYLADFTSADRSYPDINEARAAVDSSLDEGYEYTLSYTIGYLLKKGSPIHPDTIDAYNAVILSKEKLNGNI